MNLNVSFDWKVVAAVGLSATCIILSLKIDATGAERVLTAVVSTQLGSQRLLDKQSLIFH